MSRGYERETTMSPLLKIYGRQQSTSCNYSRLVNRNNLKPSLSNLTGCRSEWMSLHGGNVLLKARQESCDIFAWAVCLCTWGCKRRLYAGLLQRHRCPWIATHGRSSCHLRHELFRCHVECRVGPVQPVLRRSQDGEASVGSRQGTTSCS